MFWRRAIDEPKEDDLGGPRGARSHCGKGVRKRTPVPGAARAGGSRPSQRLAQSPLFPRDARPRGQARSSLRPPPRADLLRPRQLQVDQRGDRPSRWGLSAGGGGRTALRSVVRGADIPCRVGGDEFAVILPESSLEDVERFFQRLQLAIQGQPIGRIPNLGVSAGMAELGRDDDATSLFRRVDQALYRAKRAGKGRVMTADDPEASSEAP